MPGVTMTDAGVSAFSAVAIACDPDTEVQPSPPTPVDKPCRVKPCGKGRRSGAIEIRLVNGRTVKVDETIAPNVLARLVAALDGDDA